MCGRYSLFTPPADVEDRFDARFEEPFAPRYNAAPGQRLPVITNESPESIRTLEWGLVPAWADDGDSHINARAETLHSKPSFRGAYENRRCLVLADGFYEWVDTDAGRRPYRIAFEDDRPFAMAGLWERWEPETRQSGLGDFGAGIEDDSPDDTVRETFAVVTTEPNAVVADLHHRMAAILAPEDERRWLEADDPRDVLEPYPADEVRAYPISTTVNDPTNDGPELIEPVESA